MSLIGCHTLVGTGIEYPKKKPTWRYIKGSEKDFAHYVTDMNITSIYITESGLGFFGAVKEKEETLDKRHTLLARRERVTSVNDDRLVQALIVERGSRYGKFADGAEIMQKLKDVMHKTEGWSRLTNSQREALDMIQHKIGRALNGDPTYDDNWKDIAGYATLVAEELNGVKK